MGGFCPSLLCYHCSDAVVATGWLPIATVAYGPLPQCMFIVVKARLMTKDFTQREENDYNETFSPVSSKDSFRIIMTLVIHYNLEIHQMDVKTTFLNGDLYESVYMAQPKGLAIEGKENLGCHLSKSIYGLKQASRQWYLKFDETIRKIWI
jgi:hypothetical protein